MTIGLGLFSFTLEEKKNMQARTLLGFPGGSVLKKKKKTHLQSRRRGFDPWVRKITQRRKWHPIPVFLPGESYGQRSLVGYSPWGHRVGHD